MVNNKQQKGINCESELYPRLLERDGESPWRWVISCGCAEAQRMGGVTHTCC